jgi:hypothetical protein
MQFVAARHASLAPLSADPRTVRIVLARRTGTMTEPLAVIVSPEKHY